MREPLPAHVIASLEARGLWNGDGISRAACARECRSCGEVVMVGLDAERCGTPAYVGTTPIDAVGEAIALMTGRATYRMHWRGRYELQRRDRWGIAGSPAGTVRDGRYVDVRAEHRCDAPALPSDRAVARAWAQHLASRRGGWGGSPGDPPPF